MGPGGSNENTAHRARRIRRSYDHGFDPRRRNQGPRLQRREGGAERARARLRARNQAQGGDLLRPRKVQLGVILVNELMAAPGVEVLGPLPPELQSYTVFHAGVGVGSKDSSAAKALIKFLTTPAARAVFKAKGQGPGGASQPPTSSRP